jgi:hypothetical protein
LLLLAPADVLNATVPTAGLTVTQDVAFGRRPGQRIDIYRPKDASGLPSVVLCWQRGR